LALILVIDDEKLVRGSIRGILAAEGHDVLEAENGSKIDALLSERLPDLVITDLLMPEREGIETIMALRKRSATVKILAISGGGRTHRLDFLDLAKKIGANATLAKPFDRAALVDSVRALLKP
jgi:DNA-binding response OmpR family regulator